jgi:hypothetical protein
MNKAEKSACRYTGYCRNQSYNDFLNGYHQAEKDIKEELSKLFQEFMLDCINDDTETHILHFVDVFNNKIKTIGDE